MKRFRIRLTSMAVLALFTLGSLFVFSAAAWAKIPTASEWQALKKEHKIPNSKFNLGKAIKNYESAREKIMKSKEERGSKKWAEQAQNAAKSAVALDKVLEKYYADAKKNHADKKEFLSYLKAMKTDLDKEIIMFSSYASKYGKGEKSTVAAALKKYIKTFKSAAKSLKKNSDKAAVCKVYGGAYRGIGTQMPELKKHHKEYASVADKFVKESELVNKMCNGKVDFDAEKGIYAMKVTVEYLEKSLKDILK
jgi:hypothetical protein